MDEILVIDYGSQYTRLLARKIREIGVYSRVDVPQKARPSGKTMGVILSGGPQSVYSSNTLDIPDWVLPSGIPILGICYGMHLLVQKFGGKVLRGRVFEYGMTTVKLSEDPIFSGLPRTVKTWMSHGDSVEKIPKNFSEIAKSKTGIAAAIRSNDEKIYAFQFHPEVFHTEHGVEMIRYFVTHVCKAKKNWKIGNYADFAVEKVRESIGNSKVIGAISGGVDSAVAAIITMRAVGENLQCVFIDNGLLRKEDESVPEKLRELGMKVKRVDASELFLEKLKGVTDPEQKRKIIGETFIEVFEKEAKLFDAEYLLQGTIYSDVIESSAASITSSKIKSHHNVGGLPEKMNLKLVEPLRELFKDEVREVGKLLGLSPDILNRHPFPGPGLAVRIIGEVTKKRVDILKRVDDVYTQILRKSGEYSKIWQAFSVLLSVKSVGVKGDERSYGYVVALRAVNSIEGMTAAWYPMPHDVLRKISSSITDRVPEIGRVVYDVSDKPPATIEWE